MARLVGNPSVEIKNIPTQKKSLDSLLRPQTKKVVSEKKEKQITERKVQPIVEKVINNSVDDDIIEQEIEQPIYDEISELEEAKELFGKGFERQAYLEMNKRLNELRNNYAYDRSAMHKEALITYVKYAYKRDEAIANDDMDSADKWGKLAAKQANDAKINPSQLSQADLSEGLTCFSQLSQAVEREVDIIPHLKKYTERPLDRIDYTIYMIMDYLRDLEGKPHIEYKDVYQYIFNQKDRNSKKFGKDVVPQDTKPAKNAILVEGEKE